MAKTLKDGDTQRHVRALSVMLATGESLGRSGRRSRAASHRIPDVET